MNLNLKFSFSSQIECKSSYYNIIKNLFEDTMVEDTSSENLAKQDQNNPGQFQNEIPENDSNQLLMVDAQIRQTNPLLSEINKLIQVKTNVYNNIKSEMESKLKI